MRYLGDQTSTYFLNAEVMTEVTGMPQHLLTSLQIEKDDNGIASAMKQKSDHGSLQVSEGRQVKEALDEVWWAGLAQPQEHGVTVLQQEHASVYQTLLCAAHGSRHSLAANIHVVLKQKSKGL